MGAYEKEEKGEWKDEGIAVPNEIYGWRPYAMASIAAFAAVMIGYDSAFIGTTLALASFKNEFGLTKVSTAKFNFLSANIVSTYQGGCFFGALAGYPIGYYLGRKWGLILSAAVFCLGSGLMLGANSARGLGLIYGGRILAGGAIGCASNLTPCYISEIAPAKIRGRLVGLYELGWQLGGIVGFWINYGINLHLPSNHTQWLIPGGLLFIGCFFMVESPRYLSSRGKNDLALKNLAWIRGLPADHAYVEREFSQILNGLEHERSLNGGGGFWGPFYELLAHRNLIKRLLLSWALFIWQNATGINAINYYSPTIFRSIGVTGTNTALLTTGVYGVIKTVGAFVWLLWVVDTFGRRNTLIVGSLGGGISMYYIGAYIAVAKPTSAPNASLSGGGISAMVFFYLWTAFYAPSWNGTPWVVGAEIFPQHIRTLTQALVAAGNWFWAFIIARFTPNMFTAMGYGVYLFFASLMFCSIVFVFFLLPETKQIPLEYMDELFDSGYAPRKAHAKVMENMRERNAAGRASLEEKPVNHHLENV